MIEEGKCVWIKYGDIEIGLRVERIEHKQEVLYRGDHIQIPATKLTGTIFTPRQYENKTITIQLQENL